MAVNVKGRVESDENAIKKFPYRILNDLSMKLKSAEDKIATLLEERESHRQAVLSESTNEVSTDDSIHGETAANVDALKEEVCQLQKKVAELVYMNNRYHLSISNCTVCTSDDDFSDASLTEVSIQASTPVTTSLITLDPSTSPVPCTSQVPCPSPGIPSSITPALSRTPPLFSRSVEKKLGDSVMKSKDRNFVSRMVRTLTKLETKYQVPEHKRKKRLFIRKPRSSPIVPREFATIYNVLTAPEPETVAVPEPFPHVRWRDVRCKPSLPNPEQCPVHSCSPDPEFYVDRDSSLFRCNYNFGYLASQYGKPFGTLPGYKTSLGVVAVPTMPVGGYVYCPVSRKWVIHAETRLPASTGGRTRRSGTSLDRRKRG